MRAVRERPRVIAATLGGLALLVLLVLLLAGGESVRTDPAAQRRADRAESQLAAQKARVKQLTGDLREAQAQAARATRRAAAARRRSVQLRRALTRERRR